MFVFKIHTKRLVMSSPDGEVFINIKLESHEFVFSSPSGAKQNRSQLSCAWSALRFRPLTGENITTLCAIKQSFCLTLHRPLNGE